MKLTLIKPNIGRREHSLCVDEGRMEPLQLGILEQLPWKHLLQDVLTKSAGNLKKRGKNCDGRNACNADSRRSRRVLRLCNHRGFRK